MGLYGNPLFYLDHLYRYNGAAFIVGPEDPAFPKSALIDGRNLGLWKSDDPTVDADLVFSGEETTVVGPRPLIYGIFVPTPIEAFHNWQRIKLYKGTAATPTTECENLDGTFCDMYAQPGVTVFNPWPLIDDLRVRAQFFGQASGTIPQQAGEFYASGFYSTSSGIVQTWEDGDEPNAFVTTTSAGNVYANERGAPRRVWRMKYERIDSAGLLTLDNVRRLAGLQTRSFWFQPPTWTEADREWVAMEDPNELGTWGAEAETNFNFGTDPAVSYPEGRPYLQVTNTRNANEQKNSIAHFTFDLNQNLRGKLIQVDVRAEDPWATLSEGFMLGVGTASGVSGNNLYWPIRAFERNGVDTVWRRITIDPALSYPATNLTSREAVDFERIRSVIFYNQHDAFLNTGRFSNLRLIEKESRPVYVELIEYVKRQSSSNPRAKLRWDVDMVVREVLS